MAVTRIHSMDARPREEDAGKSHLGRVLPQYFRKHPKAA